MPRHERIWSGQRRVGVRWYRMRFQRSENSLWPQHGCPHGHDPERDNRSEWWNWMDPVYWRVICGIWSVPYTNQMNYLGYMFGMQLLSDSRTTLRRPSRVVTSWVSSSAFTSVEDDAIVTGYRTKADVCRVRERCHTHEGRSLRVLIFISWAVQQRANWGR